MCYGQRILYLGLPARGVRVRLRVLDSPVNPCDATTVHIRTREALEEFECKLRYEYLRVLDSPTNLGGAIGSQESEDQTVSVKSD